MRGWNTGSVPGGANTGIDIGPQSRLLMRRSVLERVSTLAPFLTFDHDPYLVLGEDGHLSWILDAFTSSDS